MTQTVEMPGEQYGDFLSMLPLDLAQEDVVLNEIQENNLETMKVLTENPYPCRICAKSFCHSSSLRLHLTTHTAHRQDTCEESENCGKKASVFACALCDHVFESYPDLQRHCKVHKEGGRFSCTECEQKFDRFRRLEYHLKMHKGKTSSTPSAGNATETNFQIQFKENRNKISFICTECGECFTSYKRVLKHQKIHTSFKLVRDLETDESGTLGVEHLKNSETQMTNPSLVCTWCGEVFVQKEELQAHQETHICDSNFSQTEHVATHQSIPKGERRQERLQECGGSFIQAEPLVSDQSLHAGLKRQEESCTFSKCEPSFSCSHCNKIFRNKENLLTHQKIHTSDKPFTCEEGGKGFIQKGYLLCHQKIHGGEKIQRKHHTCFECGKSFCKKISLKKHQEKHLRHGHYLGTEQGKEKTPFNSTDCDQNGIVMVDLQICQQKHDEEENFTCSGCGKKFMYQKSFLNHQKACTNSVCEPGSIDIEQLQEMLKEGPYTCRGCGRKFTYQKSFLKHLKAYLRKGRYMCSQHKTEAESFDPNEGDQSFTDKMDIGQNPEKQEEKEHSTCRGCGQTFTSGESFLKHQEAYSREGLYLCAKNSVEHGPLNESECDQTFTDLENPQEKQEDGQNCTCMGCGRKFTYQKSFQKHLKAYLRKGLYMCAQHKTEAESFAHNEGDQSFTDKMDIGQNPEKQEEEEHSTCRGCGQTFTSGESFLKHQEAYSREGLYLCAKNSVEHGPLNESECDQRFTDLENPQEKQEDGQNCTCMGCGRKFTYQKSFQKHLKAYLRKGLYMCAQHKTEAESFDPNEGDQSFTDKMDIGQNPEKQEEEEHSTCRGCGQTFTSGESFLKHQEAYSREGLYLCAKNSVEHGPLNESECDQTFTDLENPQEKQEDGQNCTCMGCGRRFTYQKSFQKHQEAYLRKGVYLCTKNRAENEPLTDGDLGQNVTNLEKQEKQDGQNCTCRGCGRKFTYQKSYLKHQKFYFREGLHLCTKNTTEN